MYWVVYLSESELIMSLAATLWSIMMAWRRRLTCTYSWIEHQSQRNAGPKHRTNWDLFLDQEVCYYWMLNHRIVRRHSKSLTERERESSLAAESTLALMRRKTIPTRGWINSVINLQWCHIAELWQRKLYSVIVKLQIVFLSVNCPTFGLCQY
jgi:hypothetical protein